MAGTPRFGFQEFRHAPQYCPWCAYLIDAASLVAPSKKKEPEPGDLSLCLKCASPLQFMEGGKLAKITEQEIRDQYGVDLYTRFQRTRRVLLMMDRSKVGTRNP